MGEVHVGGESWQVLAQVHRLETRGLFLGALAVDGVGVERARVGGECGDHVVELGERCRHALGVIEVGGAGDRCREVVLHAAAAEEGVLGRASHGPAHDGRFEFGVARHGVADALGGVLDRLGEVEVGTGGDEVLPVPIGHRAVECIGEVAQVGEAVVRGEVVLLAFCHVHEPSPSETKRTRFETVGCGTRIGWSARTRPELGQSPPGVRPASDPWQGTDVLHTNVVTAPPESSPQTIVHLHRHNHAARRRRRKRPDCVQNVRASRDVADSPQAICKTERVCSVIWDMGGTLVDTYPQVDRALATAVWPGPPTSAHLAEVRELRTHSIDHAIATLAERHRIDPGRLDTAYCALKERWRTRPAPLMDGVREVLTAVHRARGLNLVATHRDRASAEALCRALHLDEDIDDLVSTSDGWARKPDPQMNEVLLARHRLSPADVLGVGDRLIDVRAAEASGIRAVLLDTPGTPLPDMGTSRPLVVRDLRDLLPLIGPTV